MQAGRVGEGEDGGDGKGAKTPNGKPSLTTVVDPVEGPESLPELPGPNACT